FDIPPGGFAGIPEEFRGDFGGSDSIALAEDLPGGPIGGAFAGDTFGGPGGEFGDGPFGGPGGGVFAGDTFGGPGPGGEFGDVPFGGDPGGRSFSGPGGDLISSNIGGNFGTQVIGSFGGFVGSGAGGEVAFSGPMGSGPVGVGIFGGPMGSGPTGGVGFGGPMGSGPAGGGGFGGPMGSGTAGGDGFGGPMGSGPAGGSFGFTGIYGPVAGVFAPAISDVGYSDTPYFYDDPALYDDYGTDSSISSQSIQTTDFSQSGDNNANTIDKSAESSSWTLSGFSGDDTLTGGSGSDVLFGGLGSDTLTGSGGDDQFYFTDYSDGIDTISDFGQSGDADTLLFGANPASSYTRKTMHADSGTNGSTYNISTDNTLPTIINFTADTSNYNSAANVATHLSGFKVTTDGTNAISTTESYFLLLGNGTNSSVYVWEDTGNGVIAQSELNHMANLTGIDNDTLSGVEFAFNTISGV
ncbi:MAG: hypothetical protein CMN00_06525, partial [Rickettsiales bacterium]|nr:hypothetical protein [Rickettsiales bacterium]